MKYDIYRSERVKLKFLFVPEGTNVEGSSLGLKDPDLSKLVPHSKSVSDSPAMMGVNYRKLKEDIDRDGYYICHITISITINNDNR